MARVRIVVALVAATCIATSCSSATSTPRSQPPDRPSPSTSSPSTSSPSTSSPGSSLPAGTRELPAVEGAGLPSGRFTKPDFSPRLSFRLDHGWHVGHDLVGFFDVQRRPGSLDVIAVQFALPLDATRSEAAIRQLRRMAGLHVTDRGRTTVGGLPAREVLIDSRNRHLTPARYTGIFSVVSGSLYIGSGRRLLVDFVETRGVLLAVLVDGSDRSWSAAVRAAGPVVRSIRFL